MRILFLFFLILSPLSESKLKIEITQGSETLPKIAIVPFQNEILSGRETISSLVEANMTLFGEFNSIKKTEMLSLSLIHI